MCGERSLEKRTREMYVIYMLSDGIGVGDFYQMLPSEQTEAKRLQRTDRSAVE